MGLTPAAKVRNKFRDENTTQSPLMPKTHDSVARRKNPLCPISHWIHAHWWDAHSIVQLALERAHNGGQFILRIDDTDASRNLEDALLPILDAFRWLGLDWDEGPEIGGDAGPYFQSQRSELYSAACERLLKEGKAYYDFDPPEQTQQDREAAEKEKRPFLNIRRSLELPDKQRANKLADGTPYVVRLLVDRTRKVSIDDEIRGHVEWDCGLIPDPVIVRGDGSPLYNFASVIDDAHMKISHVIRAEEHLTNTAVQVVLFEALEFDLPIFAHIPFVAAPGTKEKLSKREKKLDKYRKSPQFKKLFEIADDVLPKINLWRFRDTEPGHGRVLP